MGGVEVPEHYAMTPASELEPSLVISEKNVEVRSELIKKLGAKRVHDVLGLKPVEYMTGEELFSKYPIGDYAQQGDVLLFPDKGITTLGGFESVDNATKIRLKQGVFYELLAGTHEGETLKALRMGNPSLDGEEHMEFVDKECANIFEAMIFRNFQEGGDWKKMIREKVATLPYQLS